MPLLLLAVLVCCHEPASSSAPRISVLLEPAAITMFEGERVPVAARVSRNGASWSDAPLVWSSDAPAVATVDAGGVITGVSAGGTTVRATVDGVSADVRVAVSPGCRNPSISISPASSLLRVGDTLTFVAATCPRTDVQEFSWRTTDSTIGTITSNGVLTARGAGEALVLVSLRADSTRSAVASLRVTR